MSENLITNFADTEAQGRITLVKNPFKNGASYYGRFNRNTVNTRTLIARIQGRKAGTNELNVQQIAGFLKEETLAALRAGEAVNLLDLGILYIRPSGVFNGSSFERKDGGSVLEVRFSPSRLAQEAVAKIRIADIRESEAGMKIRSVKDTFSGLEDGLVSAGRAVRLTGEQLKVAGEGGDGCGVYLCPVGEGGSPTPDETRWLKCERLMRNTPSVLEFYLPDGMEAGRDYRFVVRSRFHAKDRLLKSVKGCMSSPVQLRSGGM